MKMAARNSMLICGVVAMVVLALAMGAKHDDGFSGSDQMAKDEIGKICPRYRPWFTPLWEPPGSEMESLLFSLQAALGAGVVAYLVGYRAGMRRARRES